MSFLDSARLWFARLVAGPQIDRHTEGEIRAAQEVDDKRWYNRSDFADLMAGGARAERAGEQREGTTRVAETDNFRNLVNEDRGWTSISGGEDIPAVALREIQDQCRFFYYRHPFGRNIVNNLMAFVFGPGFMLKFKTPAKQAQWDAFSSATRWPRGARRTAINLFIYGEWLRVKYPLSNRTIFEPKSAEPLKLRRSEASGGAVEHFRGFSPRTIVDVQYDPHDMEKLVSVTRSYLNGKSETVKIVYAPEDMIFYRDGVVGDGVRGRPRMEPIMRPLVWADGFVRDRVVLNGMRTRIPIVREIEQSSRAATEGQRLLTLNRPASVLTVGKGEKWTYPSLNTGGAEANEDWRALVRYCASGINFPEFLLSSDASSANKASLEQAADMLEPVIEEIQEVLGYGFCDEAQAVTGERPEPYWIIPERKEFLDKVRAYSMAHADEVMSRSTYGARLGLDYAAELPLIVADKAARMAAGLGSLVPLDGENGKPPFGADEEDDAEDDDAEPGAKDDEEGAATA